MIRDSSFRVSGSSFMSGRSSTKADSAGCAHTLGRDDHAIQSRAYQFAECVASRAPVFEDPQPVPEESSKDLSGQMLSRLEFEFATLFRGGPP